MKHILTVLATTLALGACATPPPKMVTRSGAPEVLFRGLDREQTMDRIVGMCASKPPMQVVDASPYMVSCTYPENTMHAALMYGVSHSVVAAPPVMRFAISGHDGGSVVRVSAGTTYRDMYGSTVTNDVQDSASHNQVMNWLIQNGGVAF